MKIFLTLSLFFNLSFANGPFPYDLHLSTTLGKSSKKMIVAHGMGGNHTIAHSIRIDKTLVSFNFPDYNGTKRGLSGHQTTYGTIDEVLPLLYVIKKCVVVNGESQIDLYGFSAGGGAVINALQVLNTTRYDSYLEGIGIFQKEKEQILQAIQKGLIILDTPLKSVKEIIDFRGPDKNLEIFAKRYQENDMDPIESLKYLEGLSLKVILHFQKPDEILSNRDDDLFFSRLKTYNKNGTNYLIEGRDKGHSPPHRSLWNFYKKTEMFNS